jgi:glutamate decarboxylase
MLGLAGSSGEKPNICLKVSFVVTRIDCLSLVSNPRYIAELIFNLNYLGSEQASFTLNFSRGASHVISQYYKLMSLGKKGYRRVMLDLICMAEYLASNLERMGSFILMSKRNGQGLPLVAFRLDPAKGYLFDEFAIAHELRQQGGWVVPAYTMAPHSEELKIIRVVIREDFTHSQCDALIADIQTVLHRLSMMSVHMAQSQNGEYVSTNLQFESPCIDESQIMIEEHGETLGNIR